MGTRYHMPAGLAAALCLLAEHREKALIVAGGTIATPRLRASAPSPEHLIDIACIAELRGIEKSGSGRLVIGALTTCAELATSPLVVARAPILAQAALSVGGPQIRNVATLGGNIASRCPRADLLPALLVLDCAVTLQRAAGRSERVPLSDYLAAIPRPDELVTGIECEAAPTGAAVVRLATRQSLSPAIVSVAARLATRSGSWTCVRIAVGGAAPRAVRVDAAERALASAGADFAKGARLAAEAACAAADPESDAIASASYRRHIVGVLTQRALVAANTRVASQ